MKAGHIAMLIAVIIIVGIILRNAPGFVAGTMATGVEGTNFIKALEGPAPAVTKGTFNFGSGQSVKLG